MDTLYIDERALEHILWGAAFLGSGGGGSVEAGQFFIQRIASTGKDIPLWTLPLSDEQKQLHGCAMADIGANSALDPKQDEALLFAYDTLLTRVAETETISAVFPAETGAENMLAPFVVAAHHGLAVVDGDGAGRAIPTLPLCTFSLDQTYKDLPIAMANGEGDRLVVDSESNATHEPLIRDLTQLKRFNNSASLAMWPDTLENLAGKCVAGAVTTAMSCGRLFEALRNKDQTMLDSALPNVNTLTGYVIGKGKVESFAVNETGGFSFARIKIKNSKSNVTYTLIAQNESLICYADDNPNPVAYAPTSICCFGVDGFPYTNAELTKQSTLDKQLEVFLVAVSPREALRNEQLVEGFTKIIEELVVVSPTARQNPELRLVVPLGDLIVNLWQMKNSFIDYTIFLSKSSLNVQEVTY